MGPEEFKQEIQGQEWGTDDSNYAIHGEEVSYKKKENLDEKLSSLIKAAKELKEKKQELNDNIKELKKQREDKNNSVRKLLVDLQRLKRDRPEFLLYSS